MRRGVWIGLLFCDEFRSNKSIALRTGDVPAAVRVTHPFHPLVGQAIEVVYRRPNWGEDRIFYHERAGYLASIPTVWTSAAPEDPFLVVSAGRSWFRATDLTELAQLIGTLRS